MSSGIGKNGSAILAVAAIVYLIPAFARRRTSRLRRPR